MKKVISIVTVALMLTAIVCTPRFLATFEQPTYYKVSTKSKQPKAD